MASDTARFRWYWFLGPEVLIAAYLLAAVAIYRFWAQEPFRWACLYAGAAVVGAGVGCHWPLRKRLGLVEAPPLFRMFWLLIICLELFWILW